MSEVQRTGRVGRDEFHQHAVRAGRLAPVGGARGHHLGHHRLLGGGFQAQVDEARPGDLERRDPALHGRLAVQGVDECAGDLARVLAQGLGERHRGGAGEVAVGRLLGRFIGRCEPGFGGDLGDRGAQRREEVLFDLDHGSILRGGPARFVKLAGAGIVGRMPCCSGARRGPGSAKMRLAPRLPMHTATTPFDPAPASEPPALPRYIGKYRVLRRLGEGATAEVFLCHDDFKGQDVAIKRVRPNVNADPMDGRYSARFFAAEAALVGRLNHPNVVQIFDAVPDPVAPYLVMEVVQGSTLRPFCRADQLLALELVVEIGFKCAMALGYVYRQGLIHRDVKPANLLAVINNGTITDVKISDFGSVLNLSADTTQIYRVGSLAYMSPEQLDGGSLDSRADMYSLGAVLYHLIAGRPPFDAQQQSAMMHQIYHVRPAPLGALRDGVSPGWTR